jgi:hypothetical protein
LSTAWHARQAFFWASSLLANAGEDATARAAAAAANRTKRTMGVS